MLVCPSCQSENSPEHQFCQECGTPLGYNLCPGCGHLVEFDQLHCPLCGTVAGQVRTVVIYGDRPEEWSVERYVPLTPVHLQFQTQQLQVLDLQPFQQSPWGSDQALPIAQLYRSLSAQLYQAFPTLLDVWMRADNAEVVVVADRSDLLQLQAVMQLAEPLPPVQILHWLYEMMELWAMLQSCSACRSLLVVENLRLDEDQALCLQRIYPDTIEASLSELGHLWRTLFAAAIAQAPLLAESLELVFDRLESGDLSTLESVRSQLKEIVEELPNAYFETTMTTAANSMDPHEPSSPVNYSDNSDGDEMTVPLASLQPKGAPTVPTGGPTAGPTEFLSPAALVGLSSAEDGEADTEDQPTIVLPMQLFSLDDIGRTDIGQQRDHNEDFFGIESQLLRLESPMGRSLSVRNLYILCDGMGGHAGGEVASALAVNTLRHYFRSKWHADPLVENSPNHLPSPEELVLAVHQANMAIYEENQQSARSGSGRMGTTLVALLVQDTEVAAVHVGDSRLYRYTRKHGLEQLTIDHEVGQREIQRGVEPEIAYARPDAYQLTQALGPRDDAFVKPDVQYLQLNEDALFLLCSDGITDNNLLEIYCDSHIQPLLSSQANLDQGVKQLIELANEHNGHDNITLVAVRAKVRPNFSNHPR